ncbi:S8 family serine peptidase [Sphingosinicellaceae bacterium]|nr:S8 family serine peptidase [Sphingosinicellaceae bacterium]
MSVCVGARAFLAVPLLMLAACGGGGGGGVVSTPTPTPTPTPAPTPTPTPTPTNYDTAEYRRSNGASQAQAIVAYQSGVTGAGVVAGVVDSGVDPSNSEFAGKISPMSADLAGSRGIADEGGHGSAVADVLLGARNDVGIHGVAFDATLLVLKTDTPGSCAGTPPAAGESACSYSDSAIARGVDLAVTAHARVVNISLGGVPANAALHAAIDRATAAGVIIVISAGNDYDAAKGTGANPDPLAQIAIDPAAHGLVLIAGATDATKTTASFSNKAGNSANFYLTALGVGVRSIDQTGASFLYDGTSLSAPVVSGAIALLAQAFPSLTPAQIVDLLLRTATDLGAPGVDAVYGHGELNLAAAFQPQGATSLTKSAVSVSLTNNATLSPAMGDAGQAAGQTGLSASIRDGYGRGYSVDLAPTIRTAPHALRLVPALSQDIRSLGAVAGGTSFALAVMNDAPLRLQMTSAQPVTTRAVAGSIASKISATTSFAVGYSQASEGLGRGLAGTEDPGFLVAERADGARGLGRTPQSSIAVRQQFGGLGITATAENGELRFYGQPDNSELDYGNRRPIYQLAGFSLDGHRGIFALTGGLSRLTERDTVLGARFAPALGGGGASSWFADIGATLSPGQWRLVAALRRGWTRVDAAAVRSSSTLATGAISFDIERHGIFRPGDAWVVRWSQPLRVTGGALVLTDFDTATRLDLAPAGHERTVETGYSRAVGRGWISGNAYWRTQPDNFAASPADVGAALRYGVAF